MSRLRITVVFISFFAIACHPKSRFEISESTIDSVPDSEIGVEKMIEIMTDIHLAESWVIEEKNDSISDVDRLKNYYGEIYSKHGISDEEYKRSFAYYSERPELMNYIYTRITDKLNLLESQNRNLSPKINAPDSNGQKM